MIDLTPAVSLYASFTRGLEESDVAPETAANRDGAPPAIRTRQIDAGATIRAAGMTLLAGVLDIERPYYGVDGSNIFRRSVGGESCRDRRCKYGLVAVVADSLPKKKRLTVYQN